MTPTFNLTEEPWVVCLDLDGAEQTLSLRDVLVRAHELTEIQGDPPVAAALLRLLVAVVHRVLDGPKTMEEWAAAWRTGCLKEATVDAYLERWKHRFDLFSSTEPFFQALLPDTSQKPPAALDPAAACGHNATLFDHSMDGEPSAMSAAVAARALVALQSFTAGGLLSGETGGRTSGKAGVLAGAWVYVVTGPSLFHTLLLNTPLYDPASERPFPPEGTDAPVWERPVPAAAQTRSPAGWLDLLTYPARRVQLVAGVDRALDAAAVSAVALTDGDRPAESWSARGREQNLAFRETTQGWAQRRPSEGRDLWRDADVLLRAQPDEFARPRIIEHVARLVHEGVISGELRLGLDAYALATDQAKYLYWRHQRLPLRSRLFDASDEAQIVADALATAEGVAADLTLGVAELAGRPLGAGLDREEKQRRRKSVALAMADYWAHLGSAFNRFVAELAETGSGLESWSESVQAAARKVWQEWAASVPESPDGFRREAVASRHYRSAIALARSLQEGDE